MSIPVATIQQHLKGLFADLLGLQLSEVSGARVVATMAVRAELCTTGGSLHGGALMAFADTLGAVGTFVNLPPGKGTTTIDSSTQFIGAAKAGDSVTGTSVALHRGRTTMVWQTTIRDAAGKLCAVVTQTQLVLG